MGLDTEEESGAGARLLGVSLGALSTTAQLALLPGEAVPASAADPAGPADARGDLPLIPGRRGGEWVPGADVEHTELGRGWVMRRVAAVDSLSRLAEVAVRFEVAGARAAGSRCRGRPGIGRAVSRCVIRPGPSTLPDHGAAAASASRTAPATGGSVNVDTGASGSVAWTRARTARASGA